MFLTQDGEAAAIAVTREAKHLIQETVLEIGFAPHARRPIGLR